MLHKFVFKELTNLFVKRYFKKYRRSIDRTWCLEEKNRREGRRTLLLNSPPLFHHLFPSSSLAEIGN